MRRHAVYLLLPALALAMVAVISPGPAAGHSRASDLIEVGSEQLVDHPDKFDGKRVLYTGEVVGEVLRRGDYAWLTVNDDEYGHKHTRGDQELKGGNTGLGIYCRWEDAERIEYVGSYSSLGDLVEVTGTFYKASAEHGGELMIEARDVRVIRPGREVSENDFGSEPLLAFALGIVALGLAGAFLFARLRSGGFAS